MSVVDKFLDFMRLNPEDEDDFDFNDDFEFDDDYVEEKTKKSIRKEKREEEQTYREPVREKVTKPTPITKSSRKQTVGMEVCVIKPSSIEDEIEIADTLLNGRTVVINMEGLNVDIAQRIIDFISGATYSMNGNLQKISNYIFLATPCGVDISGDIQNLVSSFDGVM